MQPIPGFDDAPERFGRALGLRPGVELVGDPALPLHARLWLRPALTVIGIDGHPIKGSSNQIVARARRRGSACGSRPARIPTACSRRCARTSRRSVPWGLELRFRSLEGAPAWETTPTGPAFEATTRALRAGFGVDPVFMGVGGSIPFVGPFADAFGGIPALLLGPADPGSRIHGEDESLHLDDWRKLIRSEVCLLAELAALPARRASRSRARVADHTSAAAASATTPIRTTSSVARTCTPSGPAAMTASARRAARLAVAELNEGRGGQHARARRRRAVR